MSELPEAESKSFRVPRLRGTEGYCREWYESLLSQCEDELKSQKSPHNPISLLDLLLRAYECQEGITREHSIETLLGTPATDRGMSSKNIKFSKGFYRKEALIKHYEKLYTHHDQIILVSNGIGFEQASKLPCHVVLCRTERKCRDTDKIPVINPETGAVEEKTIQGDYNYYNYRQVMRNTRAVNPLVIVVFDGDFMTIDEYRKTVATASQRHIRDGKYKSQFKAILVSTPYLHKTKDKKSNTQETEKCYNLIGHGGLDFRKSVVEFIGFGEHYSYPHKEIAGQGWLDDESDSTIKAIYQPNSKKISDEEKFDRNNLRTDWKHDYTKGTSESVISNLLSECKFCKPLRKLNTNEFQIVYEQPEIGQEVVRNTSTKSETKPKLDKLSKEFLGAWDKYTNTIDPMAKERSYKAVWNVLGKSDELVVRSMGTYMQKSDMARMRESKAIDLGIHQQPVQTVTSGTGVIGKDTVIAYIQSNYGQICEVFEYGGFDAGIYNIIGAWGICGGEGISNGVLINTLVPPTHHHLYAEWALRMVDRLNNQKEVPQIEQRTNVLEEPMCFSSHYIDYVEEEQENVGQKFY